MCVVVVLAVEQIAVYHTNLSRPGSPPSKRKKINNDYYFAGGFVTDNVSWSLARYI